MFTRCMQVFWEKFWSDIRWMQPDTLCSKVLQWYVDNCMCNVVVGSKLTSQCWWPIQLLPWTSCVPKHQEIILSLPKRHPPKSLQKYKPLLSFPCDCAKSGFAIHFEWQLQIVITPSISNGFLWNLMYDISHMLSRFLLHKFGQNIFTSISCSWQCLGEF